jgi:FixJ family two-component response regulator
MCHGRSDLTFGFIAVFPFVWLSWSAPMLNPLVQQWRQMPSQNGAGLLLHGVPSLALASGIAKVIRRCPGASVLEQRDSERAVLEACMDGTDFARLEPDAPPAAMMGGCPGEVVIVDDDPLVRAALDSLFRSVGYATRLYSGARQALEDAWPDRLTCVVTDVRMPDVGGFEFQSALARRSADIPMIFMTGHGDIPMSVRAMKAGAVDFLSKPFRDQDMLDAVRSAMDRGRVDRAAERSQAQAQARYGTLTPREREVMGGVVRGLLNKQIAGDLGIAEITVKLHRSSVMRKMGVRRLPDLVRLADALDDTARGQA